MDISIIDNDNKSHKSIINGMIKTSTKLTIAVAFLKMSGINNIFENLSLRINQGLKTTFIIGTNFYQTEPQALIKLLNLSKNNKNIEIFVHLKKNKTFHPKMYLLENQNSFETLIGSANMTNGGLTDNFELSSYIKDESSESKLLRDLNIYVDNLKSQSKILNPLILSQYKREFDLFVKKIKKAEKDANSEIQQLTSIDIEKLNDYAQEYLNDESEQQNWLDRVEDYKKAKRILNIIAKNEINSKKEFMELYNKLVGGKGYDKLWHSGSIVRSKNKIANKYKSFCKVVAKIETDTSKKIEPSEIFGNAKKIAENIDGLGVNVITEIMNTYDPMRYSVLNNNPLGSLHEIGFQKFKTPNSFKPEDYQQFNDILIDILNRCNFNNLGQVDHLCNYIYWKYVKK